MIASYRQATSVRLLHGLSWASQRLSGQPNQPGLHRLKVLSGPLRGLYISTPALTRLSFCLGTYQRDVLAAMKAHVRPGMTVFDLGAHVGYFTLVLSKLVGRAGRVFAFEPDPRNLAALRSNLSQVSQAPVTVTAAAVTDAVGAISFATFAFSSVSRIADSTTASDASWITVPAVTLDAFVYDDGNPVPDFVKIDVEGAERNVILGAKRLLNDRRPTLIVEVNRRNWDETKRLMRSHGYEATPQGGEGRMAKAGLADVLFTPRSNRSHRR